MSEELVTLPVTGWELKSVPGYDAIIISFSYLTHSTQRDEDADQRNFAFHTTQARELAQRILATLDRMESGAIQAGGPPQH